MKIAICAGHHEHSKGAVNKKFGLNEFDASLRVLVTLGRLLIKAGHEVHSFTGGLTYKVHQINAGHFDLALDLHFNADADHLDPDDFDDDRGHGAMVMFCPRSRVYGETEPLSERRNQASLMSSVFSKHLGNPDRGGRAGWYWGPKTLDANRKPTIKDYFLRKTNCAAFIPEPGYIDNNGFCEQWLTSNNHHVIAEAIAASIKTAFPKG